MDGTVEIGIPVDADVAAALADPRRREAVGRVVSRMLRPGAGGDPLVAAIDRLRADAEARGLTDDVLDAELTAYNAERRG